MYIRPFNDTSQITNSVLSLFFNLFLISVLYWVVSIAMSSNSLIFYSSMSKLLLIPFRYSPFQMLHFHFQKFSFKLLQQLFKLSTDQLTHRRPSCSCLTLRKIPFSSAMFSAICRKPLQQPSNPGKHTNQPKHSSLITQMHSASQGCYTEALDRYLLDS